MFSRRLISIALAVLVSFHMGCKSYHAGGCGWLHRHKRCDSPAPCPPPGPIAPGPFTNQPPAPIAPAFNPAVPPGPTPDFTAPPAIPRGSSYAPLMSYDPLPPSQ
jgi:hypothetical protein